MYRYAAAERVLRRALRVLGDASSGPVEERRARVLTSLALSVLATRGKPEAMATLKEARHVARRSGSVRVLTLTYIQAGAINATTGDWQAVLEGVDHVREGMAWLAPRERCAAMLNVGLARLSLLELSPARADLNECLDLARAHALGPQEFKARHNLGCLEYFAGNLPEALTLMEAADAMEVEVSRARARLDHALVLLDAGLLERAEEMLTEALATARRERLRLDEGEIDLDLAMCALMREDLPAARRQARAAARAFASRGAEARASYAVLVRAAVELGADRSLDEELRSAVAPPPRGRLSAPQDRLAARVAAQDALERGDLATSRSLVRRLRRAPQASTASALHERLLQARLAAAEGDERTARRVLRSAGILLATRQHTAGSLDVRAGLALHGRQLATFDLDLAMTGGDPARILVSLERWRAVSQRVTPVAAPDPETAALLSRLRRTTSLLAGGGDGTGGGLRAEADRLQARISHRDWARAEQTEVASRAPTTTLVRVRRTARRSGAVVVVLFDHHGSLWRLTVGSGRTTGLVRLGTTRRVLALADRLRGDTWALAQAGVPALRDSIGRALASSSTALDEAVLGGLPTRAATGPVVLVPIRGMASVPWRLLPSLHEREVVVTSSLSRWVADSDAGSAPTAAVGVLAGPGLPRSVPEAVAVRGVWTAVGCVVHPPGPVTAQGTSEQAVHLLGSAQMVHIAAHGTHVDDNPLFSSLRLVDGPVFAHELPRPVVAEHVVLSACDVGRARTVSGEESLGMTSALISLGARSVVAAVAPVPDDVAEAVMLDYHRSLVEGLSAARALLVASHGRPGAGVFTVFGADWAVRIPHLRSAEQDRASVGEAPTGVPVP